MIDAPIKSVTVLEDRAFITRVFSVELAKGQHTLRLGPVTPVLADKTLSLEVVSGGGDLLKVREQRVVRERDNLLNEERKASLEKLLAEQRRLQERERNLLSSWEDIRELVAHRLTEIRENVSWGEKEFTEWNDQLKLLRKKQLEAGLSVEQIHEEQKLLREKLAECRGENQGKRPEDVKLGAQVEVLVEFCQDFKGELALRYCVAGACWRPYHQARSEGDHVTFVTRASVWQNTGEDWSEVELKLSTERSAKTTALPRLQEDILSLVDHEKEVVLETREQSVKQLEAEKAQAVQIVPGIDDGGDTLYLTCPEPFSLPSHGKPVKAEIFRFEGEAEFRMLAKPEVLSQVVRQSRQSNQSSHALLSGPVDLIQDGAAVGTTWLDYVASGERFDLTWGPERSLTLKRRSDSKEEKEKLLKGWVATKVAVDLFLSNLGGDDKVVTVTERVPVSESEDLKVKFDESGSHGEARPDKNGFVTWEISLAGGKREKVSLRYTMSRKKKASYA